MDDDKPDFRFRPPPLADPFRMDGEFWAVGNARRKVGGTVRFAPDEGTHLDLVGPLWAPGRRGGGLFDGRNTPTILGMLPGSVPVTLFKCFDTGPNYYANLALHGRHYQSFDSVRLEAFNLRLDNLEQWVAAQPWESASEPVSEGRERWSVSHTDPQAVVVRVPAFRLRIEVVASLQLHTEIGGLCSLRHTDTVRVVPDAPVTWKTFWRHTANLRRLFVRLMGSPLKARSVEGVPMGHSRATAFGRTPSNGRSPLPTAAFLSCGQPPRPCAR